jgi:hypothetical protein
VTTKHIHAPAYDKESEDLLVATIPKVMSSMPGQMDYWRTQGEYWTLGQYANKYPCPSLTFTSVSTFFADTAEDVETIYTTHSNHTCGQCEEGKRMALDALAKNDDMTVVITVIRYVEHWPDLSMDIEVKTPQEATGD